MTCPPEKNEKNYLGGQRPSRLPIRLPTAFLLLLLSATAVTNASAADDDSSSQEYEQQREGRGRSVYISSRGGTSGGSSGSSSDSRSTSSGEPRHYDSDEEPYAFQYEVDAPYHGTWHDRKEVKSGRKTEGQFRVALPDHRLQTVTYQATNGKGFEADVHFEQHPDFKSLRGNIGKAPVIGESVVPAYQPPQDTAIVEQINSKPKPQEPSYGYQISVGNDYGQRRPKPSKSIADSHGYDGSTKPSPSSSVRSRRPTVTRTKILARPISHVPRVTTKPVHTDITSSPLSAFVSIASLHKSTTPSIQKPVRISRPVTHAPVSGYYPSSPSVAKPSAGPPLRPLRTRQRTTSKPSYVDETPIASHSSSHFESPKSLSHIPSYGDKSVPSSRPLRTRRPGLPPVKPSSISPSSNSIPKDLSVPHLPKKDEPDKGMEPPATTDESFSVAGKKERYTIRREGMNSIRSRLNSIVHDK